MQDYGRPTHRKPWQTLSLGLLMLLSALLMAFSPQGNAADDESQLIEVRIGLRAHRGAERALKRWGPTADHLTANIPGYRFVMIPFESVAELNEAVSRAEFDFVLASPAAYVEYEMRYGVRHLVTVINNRQGRGYTEFGSVIFTRADRTDINTLLDLKGKNFMAVSEFGFGGWRVAWHEMREQGIDPYRDLARVMFGGGIQPDVVKAVMNGEADAGSVRTDMLERLAAAGKIRTTDYKVLNPKQTDGFPFAHSTRLYPEWPFARLAHTEDNLAEQVTRVLLNMTADLPAAHSGQYLGWHTPLNYQPVRNLLKDLGVGPYTGHATITFGRLLQDYGPWLGLGLLILLLLSAMMVRMKLLNARLLATEVQLKEMAMHDGLTGLANRHRLDGFLAQEWRQAARKRREISAVLFDIDHFKQYNDHYGHVAGDHCLRRVAELAAGLFRRANDLVVRYGGEEFLIILLDTGLDDALRQAEALRAKVAELRIPHSASAVADHLTISIGVTTCSPRPKIMPERLIHAADTALYQAKSTGRNRVVSGQCNKLGLVSSTQSNVDNTSS